MYRYVAEITSKESGVSHWVGIDGDKGLLGGQIGELAIYDDFRDIYLSFDKALWLKLGGTLSQGSAVIDPTASSDKELIALLQSQIAELNRQLDAAGAGDLSSELAASIKEVEALKNQIKSLQQSIADAANGRLDIATLQNQINSLEAQLNSKTRIAEELRVKLEILSGESIRSDDDISKEITPITPTPRPNTPSGDNGGVISGEDTPEGDPDDGGGFL